MTTIDLLVFGPHPDDIEIGFGGAVALHVAHGFRVGLCDLTQGELGSNGTVADRLAEAEAARAVLGAEWRVNLQWPDGGRYDTPEHVTDVVRLVRSAKPRVVARADGTMRVATVMRATLSMDHRVLDGAVGANFLGALKSRIENASELIN